MTLKNDFLKSIDLTKVRSTVINWPNQVRAIVDGYRGYRGIIHGVQKDAIQNAWDARIDKKGRGWSCSFELILGKKYNFFTITDRGTHGLTGHVLSPEELELDLPVEERWGRFENVAFTKEPSEEALGSRGRGKFIFVGASEISTVLYDSLREDGTYRFGFRTVVKTGSPIEAYDEKEGKGKLWELTQGVLHPLKETGTRVIIVNPISEFVDCLKSGEFLKYIGETWWEILLKYAQYGVKIDVKFDEKTFNAEIPDDFKLPEKDSKNYKVWFLKKGFKITVSGNEFRIKRLHIISNRQESLPEDIRGISWQRGGMKICTTKPPYMTKDLSDSLYGYITFDKTIERNLLMDEGPEHYSYSFRRSLPGTIKRRIEDEILKFAREKLNWGVDPRELRRQQQRDAERRALLATNNFARALGVGKGPGKSRKGTNGEREAKLIRIQLEELELPRLGDLKVNYNEKVKNIKAKIINDEDMAVTVRFKLFLRYFDKIIKPYSEEDITIPPKSRSHVFGPFNETLTRKSFPDRGKYTVVAKIVSLMDADKGAELDYKTKSFYLEEDPPMRGLFERCEALGFPDDEEVKYLMGYSETGSERGLVLYYNLNHTTYTVVADIEDDLTAYILRIAGHELCRYDLLQEKPVLFNLEEKDDPGSILNHMRQIIGKLLYKFHKGEI